MLQLGAYLLRRQAVLKPVINLLFLMSFAVMAVGVFTKDFTIAHGIVASLAFFLSALASLTSARIPKLILSLAQV